MNEYTLEWGTWNHNHDIAGRDIGCPETHKTMDAVNASIRDKQTYYQNRGYELWFINITLEE